MEIYLCIGKVYQLLTKSMNIEGLLSVYQKGLSAMHKDY